MIRMLSASSDETELEVSLRGSMIRTVKRYAAVGSVDKIVIVGKKNILCVQSTHPLPF